MPIRDPLRYPWVTTYGIAACIAVLPFAIVFGAIRGIPLFWRVVDTLFGIGGLVVLLVLRHHLSALGQPAPASARTASQFDGADSASPVFGFGAILILAGRAAHLEAVRPHPCHVHGVLSSGESS